MPEEAWNAEAHGPNDRPRVMIQAHHARAETGVSASEGRARLAAPMTNDDRGSESWEQ